MIIALATNNMKAFTPLVKWKDRNTLPNLKFPGVYAIARSEHDITGEAFSWRPEIIYIGMTNSRGGLRSRLRQFERTIIGKSGHGGAHRVRFKYPDYNTLVPTLYVSVRPYKCDVRSNMPSDLREMGAVAKFEYDCFARFVEEFNRLPEFNDKERSPKK